MATSPKNSLLEVDEAGKVRMVPVSAKPAEALPGLMVYRFSHSMYYANAEYFTQEVLGLADQADPPLVWLCIDGIAIDEIDYSAAATLAEMVKLLQDREVKIVLSEIADFVRAELDRSHVTELIGNDAFFDTIEDVVAAYRQANPAK